MTSKKDIGLAIKIRRKKKGLTQEQLGKKMDPKTPKETISRIETGNYNYTINYLFKIAAILKCDISDFCISQNGHKPHRVIIFEGSSIEDLKEALREKERE